MKKKYIITTLICIIIMFVFVGCAGTPNVHINNDGKLINTAIGEESLVEIGGGLWYDSSTNVVYWWNGVLMYSDYATTPTPYYASNGFPYIYNPETNTLEEVNINTY